MVFALETFWPASRRLVGGAHRGAARRHRRRLRGDHPVPGRGPAGRRALPLPHGRAGRCPASARPSRTSTTGRRTLGRPSAPPSRHAPPGWARTASVCGVAAGSSIRSSRSSAARAPISACGIRTVVSGGREPVGERHVVEADHRHVLGAAQPPLGQRRRSRPAPAGRCRPRSRWAAARPSSSRRAAVAPSDSV